MISPLFPNNKAVVQGSSDLEIAWPLFINITCFIFRLAEEKKESGNHLYKFKNYKGALAMYDEAIKLCPENAAYYGNRSACCMMLGLYKKALEDAQKAVALDPTFTKGYIRIAKCCIALGK